MSQRNQNNNQNGGARRSMFDQDTPSNNRSSPAPRQHGAQQSHGQVYRASSRSQNSGQAAGGSTGKRTQQNQNGAQRQVYSSKQNSHTAQRPQSTQRPAAAASSGVQASSAARQSAVHRSARTKAKMRRKRNRRIAISSIAIVLVLSLVLGIYILYTKVAKELRGEDTHDGSIPEAVKTVNIPEYNGKKLVCGVICGIDYDLDDDGVPTGDQIGRTDMIMYVMFNTETGKVNILQIPRDVYVGDELSTGGTRKINSLYFASENPNNRMAPLLSMLNDQLGLPTDFYVTIDMDALKEIIAIKGSIEVYVPQDVVDPKNPDNVIEQGWRGIGPDEAEFLLRNRNYADADLTRLQVQQNFYSALFREFTTLAPKDLVMWMAVLLYRVNVGGMTPLQLGGLAQKALTVKGEDITFVRPPVIGVKYKGQAMVSLVADETADLLNEYFRPEGVVKTVDELNIHELTEYNVYGKSETSVRTMSGIQSNEEAQPEA